MGLPSLPPVRLASVAPFVLPVRLAAPPPNPGLPACLVSRCSVPHGRWPHATASAPATASTLCLPAKQEATRRRRPEVPGRSLCRRGRIEGSRRARWTRSCSPGRLGRHFVLGRTAMAGASAGCRRRRSHRSAEEPSEDGTNTRKLPRVRGWSP
jgi:hypothetical protein